MKIRIIMPKLGLTMERGTIVSWLKAVGNTVALGEPLLEIETDKIIEEIASEAYGTLIEIVKGEGDTVPVAETIGFIEGDDGMGESADDTPSENASRIDQLVEKSRAGRRETAGPGKKEETPVPRGSSGGNGPRISRRALSLARERGVDPSIIPAGSGPGGRIVEKDVLAFLEDAGKGGPPDVQEPTAVQRVVAERLTSSFSTVPHFYLSTEAVADRFLSLRQELLPRIERENGVRVTLSDLLVRLTAVALSGHPALNACWTEGRIRRLREVNVGLAMDTPRGLLVPVLKNPDRKSVAEIARERSSLLGKATEGRLTREEVSGASLTLSNLGMFGIDRFQPIINPPQSAILAVGSIKERPVGSEGALVLKPTLFLTIAIDHRVVGGAEGARYLRHLADLIQNPDSCFEER